MAKNDLFLLDTILEKRASQYSALKKADEVFDLFAFENILKDYDLSSEEIEDGWVDGGNDGGIDGFFIFLDGIRLSEIPNYSTIRKQPNIEIILITSKYEDTFRQTPVNNLLVSIQELFDLSVSSEKFKSTYNEQIIEQRDLFSATCKELLTRQPILKFRCIYVSRGDTSKIADNVINNRYHFQKCRVGVISS